MVENFDVRITTSLSRKNRFDILAVNLDISFSTRDITPLLIFENHKSHILKIFGNLIKPPAHRKHEIVANNFFSVPSYVLQVFFRGIIV